MSTPASADIDRHTAVARIALRHYVTPIGESTPLLCVLLTWIAGGPFLALL